MNHDWVKSTLGHGEAMCSRCRITNREAAVIGKLNECSVKPKLQAVLRKIEHWMEWSGPGSMPRRWNATNPDTSEVIIVYRSYEDYCAD